MSAVDIKERIEELVGKLTKDEKLMESFRKDPVGAVKSLLGETLGDDAAEKLAEGVKAKLSADKLSGLAGSLGKFF